MTGQMADVAVIIPTYNRATSLMHAIRSVRRLTYCKCEIIVVDDGSDDGTEAVIREYSDCRYLKIEHSGLPAVARNAGARLTSAGYLAFLDSDDLWVVSKLEKQMGGFSAGFRGLV